MRRYEGSAAGLLLLLGLLASFEAGKLTVGELGRPGPGFFPFYLAVALSIVSLLLLIRSLQRAEWKRALPQEYFEPLRQDKVVWTLFGLLLYGFALEPLGFLFSTAILMVFLFRIVDPLRWAAAIGASLATSVLTYALFKLWLQIPLPSGPWGL